MGIRESLLNTITSVADSDFVRVVTAAGASSKATVANLFKSFETGLGAKSSLTDSDYIRVVGNDNNAYKQSVSAMKTAMGIDALNTKMDALITCPTVSDLNEATSPNALYKFNSDASNKPTGLNYGYIFVLAEADGLNTQQIVVERGGTGAGPIWRRGRNSSGTWGNWQKECDYTAPLLVEDCNDAIDPNRIYYSNATTLNKPDNGWFFIKCNAKSGNMIFQTAYWMNSTGVAVYQRSRDTSGNWGAWVRSGTALESVNKVYTVTCAAGGYTFLSSYADLGVAQDKIVSYINTSGSYLIQLQFASEGVYLFSHSAFTNKAIGFKFWYL